MSSLNVLLKFLLILTIMGKSVVGALGRQTWSVETMMVRLDPNCLEQSGNLTHEKKGHEMDDDKRHKEEMEDREDSFQLVDWRGIMDMGFPNCVGKRQPLVNLTRSRQLGGGTGVMREGLVAEEDTDKTEDEMEDEVYMEDTEDEEDEMEDEVDIEDTEDEEDTFQLVDKRAKTLIQPRQLCQHK